MLSCDPSAAADAAAPTPAAVTQALPLARFVGEGRLTWWGLAVYDARLWVAQGFTRSGFDRHPLALELRYLRAFSGADIARTSLEEMRRAGPIDAGQAQRWQDQLRALLPDVKPGDSIAGVHSPGRGVSFIVNGKPAGEIADARFAQLFFSIWLGPSSSQQRLRDALLGDTPP